MQLEFTRFVPYQRFYKSFVSEWFFENLKALKKEKSLLNKNRLEARELGFVFVDKAKIKELNKKYRGVDKETDVLSFDGDGFVSLGELIFCMDVIKEKAKSSNLPVKLYLSMLMTHGLLHLLGYEHELNQTDQQKMFALQDKLMRKVASKLAPDYKKDFDIS